MFLKSLHIEAFRSIDQLDLTFEAGITTFVGENDTGKSTVGNALRKVLENQYLIEVDFPYGDQAYGSVVASFELNSTEVQSLLFDRLLPDGNPDASPFLGAFLQNQSNKVSLKVDHNHDRPDNLRWGDFSCTSDGDLWFDRISKGNTTYSWRQFSQLMENSKGDTVAGIKTDGHLIRPADNLTSVLLDFVREKFKPFQEFRLPSNLGRRSGELESMSGEAVASVLLSLKNHTERFQRVRYESIKTAFRTFFPYYDIEAVERSAGQGDAEIQFYKGGRDNPISLSGVSAGIHDVLTFLTNLVARDDLLFLIEHPETHLHPHAMRTMSRLLMDASERNQLIVITHDPHFVDPNSVGRLRRFWWTPDTGTQVNVLSTDVNDREIAQIHTALRQAGDREMVFARAVLLVEDESLRDFLVAVAPKLEHNLDSAGVSVIFYGGDGGHRPYHTLLDGLGIPYINLRDKIWGENPNYPQNRFFSLGMEFEEYVDSNGLQELRATIAKNVGGKSAHPRVARALGEQLEKEQIPALFDEVLGACMNLATGRPNPSS